MLSEHDRRAYEANIWKTYAFQLLQSFQLWWPIWVLYLTDFRGFSLTQVSGLEALFWVVIVLGEVPTGAVADRFGRKVSLMLGAACVVVAVVVFGVASNYWIVLASYVAWAFGLTFQSGADAALTFESLRAVGREQDYPRVAGVGLGIFSLGTLAGMLAGAPLAASTDLQFPILASAGIAFVALLVAATYREPPEVEGEERLPYRTLVAESARTAWRQPPVRAMLLVSALLIGATNAAGIFAQPFLDHHDVPVRFFGLAQAPMRLAGIAGAVLAYRIVSTFGLRATLIAAPVIMTASYALLGGWNSVYAFGATTTIVMTSNVLMPVVNNYVNLRIPNNQRATILSFRQLLSSVIIASFQPGLGVIADTISLEAVFIASAAFVAVTVPAALFYWLAADTRERETKAQLLEVEAAAGS
jgi:predicted MFS family arabinose efflux permease